MKQKLDMQGSNELMFGAELLDGRVLQGLQDRFCACNILCMLKPDAGGCDQGIWFQGRTELYS